MLDDRIVSNHIGVRFARDIALSLSSLWGVLSEFTHPVLILHGQKDFLFSWKFSERLFNKISSPDKQLKIYERHYHELYIDQDKEIVIHDILNWIGKRASNAKPLGIVPILKTGIKNKGSSVFWYNGALGKILCVVAYLAILRQLSRIPAYKNSRIKLLFFPLFWILKSLKFFTVKSVSMLESIASQILKEMGIPNGLLR